jgi:peptidoglycan/LPS O-acetylase OafA/YrhL
MTESARETSRLGWLDGLRGIAAMQVVLLHYAYAFLPAIGFRDPHIIHYAWERAAIGTPLGLPFDGITAVYLFFIMSGVALTYSFGAHRIVILPSVIRRLIRLGLPMAAALMLGAVLFRLLPDAHIAAGKLARPSWLAMPGPGSPSVAAIGHQIAFEGLLTGYRGVGLLSPWTDVLFDLAPPNASPDLPLWTLHFEFYGSLLVLALVAVRASAGRAVYFATCVTLGVGFLTSPLGLFVVGHVAAPCLRRLTGRFWQHILGAIALILGILLCTARIFDVSSRLLAIMPRPLLGPGIELNTQQNAVGAVLIIAGIACLPILQRGLERPVMRRFGQLSFSLYLTHVPLLFTVTAAAFAVVAAYLPYGASAAVASLAGMAVTFAVVIVFERTIDRPAISLSRMVGPFRLRARHLRTPAVP